MAELDAHGLEHIQNAEAVPTGVEHVKAQSQNKRKQIFGAGFCLDLIVVVGWFQGLAGHTGRDVGLLQLAGLLEVGGQSVHCIVPG